MCTTFKAKPDSGNWCFYETQATNGFNPLGYTVNYDNKSV